MIKWIKYDPGNPPDTEKVFLIYHMNMFYDVGVIEMDDGKPYWVETGECRHIPGVTHYAEINPPEE